MILRTIKIWNFRSINKGENEQPGLEVEFDPRLNLLIGANDSGKTAIIDAIRLCLGTQTYDQMRVDVEDFYQDPNTKQRATEFKIECWFTDFSDEEAGQFLEWINFTDKKDVELRVWFTAINKNNRIITNLRAGIDDEGQYFIGEARDLLRVTYLKPLRDAEIELSPGYRSRLYQILKSHPVFEKKNPVDKHPLEKYFDAASQLALDFFEKDTLEKREDLNIEGNEKGGREIKQIFNKQTKDFLETGDKREPEIKITPNELNAILRKLELIIEENKPGLGSLNLLYMAAELIHLQRENYLGLRLALIEELEAHLHPQAQLRVLKSLLSKNDDKTQYILTTHSTQLGSSIPLEHIKLVLNSKVYSLDSNSTSLNKDDYKFLERFLDSTKANLFFAKGVIFVEGISENIIIPTLAEILDRPLHKYGVSIVNVGSKAFLRYCNIFKQNNGNSIPIKVAILTDLDFNINEDVNDDERNQKIAEIRDKYKSDDGYIITVVSPFRTLEYDISRGNLYEEMHLAIQIAKKIHSKKDWISEEELKNLKENLSDINQNNIYERAKKIFEPLEKRQASKSIAAQWFSKILIDKKDSVLEKIKNDYDNNVGIKYIVEAIEHVTEKINWETNGNNG